MINRTCLFLALAAAMVCGNRTPAGTTPQGAAFTYQGVLSQNGAPANGTFHLRFELYDSLTGGAQIGADVDHAALVVDDGVLAADLDFGALAYNGDARWLQVSVLTNGGTTVTPLTPRQPVNAIPYAVFALTADGPNLTNLSASNIASGTIDSARLPTGGSWALGSALSVDGGTFTVDPINNRIGIGTASPLGPLHIAGNAAGLRLQDDDHPASYAVLEDASTGQLRLDKVAGEGGTLIDINPIPLDTTANAHVRFFRHTNTTGSKLVIFHSGNDSTAASSVIGVGGSSSVFQLDGGNFGIGTPTPTAPLHIRKHGPFMVLQDTASNSIQAGYLGFWNSSGTETGWMGYGSPGSPHMSMLNSRTGGNLAFYTQSAERLTIAANGNVGVGSTNPARKFEVISSGGQSGYFLNTGSTGTALQALNNNSSGGVSYGVFSSMNSANGFDFFAGGSVGVRYGQTSSRRWKHNITPIDSPLDRIERIRGVYFDWDAEHGGKHDVGLIAEEVGKVMPEVVAYEENGIDAAGMDYGKMSPLLVEAIKALRAEKDAEIQSLREEIAELKALLLSRPVGSDQGDERQ